MQHSKRTPHPPAVPIETKFTSNATLSVHAAEHKHRPEVYDSITTPIVQTSSYWFKDTQQVVDFNEDRYHTHEYGRYGNPTVRTLEEKLAILEAPGMKNIDCIVSSSGMASVTMMLLGLLQPGLHLIITSDCYRRTRQFITEFFPKMNVTVSILDPSDLETLKTVVSTHKAAVYFSETPTNPYLRCVDVSQIAEICHAHNCLVAIDTTFATPLLFRPLEHGADLILHSATKFISGHNDTLSGAVIGRIEVIAKIKKMQHIIGPVLSPDSAYLILRGIKTLHLRIQQASTTAMTLATLLEKHDLVTKVHYPGLPSHPDHAIAKKYMNKYFGGVLSFELVGNFNTAAQFIDALHIPYMAPSLGGVESLVELPACMSFWSFTQAEREGLGIKDTLVRFSCGVEDTDDVVSDVMQALEKIRGPITTKIYTSKSSL